MTNEKIKLTAIRKEYPDAILFFCENIASGMERYAEIKKEDIYPLLDCHPTNNWTSAAQFSDYLIEVLNSNLVLCYVTDKKIIGYRFFSKNNAHSFCVSKIKDPNIFLNQNPCYIKFETIFN